MPHPFPIFCATSGAPPAIEVSGGMSCEGHYLHPETGFVPTIGYYAHCPETRRLRVCHRIVQYPAGLQHLFPLEVKYQVDLRRRDVLIGEGVQYGECGGASVTLSDPTNLWGLPQVAQDALETITLPIINVPAYKLRSRGEVTWTPGEDPIVIRRDPQPDCPTGSGEWLPLKQPELACYGFKIGAFFQLAWDVPDSSVQDYLHEVTGAPVGTFLAGSNSFYAYLFRGMWTGTGEPWILLDSVDLGVPPLTTNAYANCAQQTLTFTAANEGTDPWEVETIYKLL